MATSQATSSDVTSRALRTLTAAESAVIGVRLRDAFSQILATVPGIGARLDAGSVSDPFNQLVIQVQVAMVLRVLANPDGILEETVDDYTRRLDQTVSTGALYLTDAEVSLLSDFSSASMGTFSVRAVPMLAGQLPWAASFPLDGVVVPGAGWVW